MDLKRHVTSLQALPTTLAIILVSMKVHPLRKYTREKSYRGFPVRTGPRLLNLLVLQEKITFVGLSGADLREGIRQACKFAIPLHQSGCYPRKDYENPSVTEIVQGVEM